MPPTFTWENPQAWTAVASWLSLVLACFIHPSLGCDWMDGDEAFGLA